MLVCIDIMPHLVMFQTITYVKEDLVGDLVEGRKTDEEKEELMDTGSDEKRQIDELVATVNATEQALDIVTNMSGASGGGGRGGKK